MAGELIVKNGLRVSGSIVATTGFTGSFSGSITSASFAATASVLLINPFSIVTGSITASVNTTPNFFLIQSGSKEIFKINTDRIVMFEARTDIPTAVTGGFYYSASGEFFLGI